MVEIVVYARSGVVERLRKAAESTGENKTLPGISVRGQYFSRIRYGKHNIKVNLVVEQAGAEFRRRNLFVAPAIFDFLKNNIETALITICDEIAKEEPATGLEKCTIKITRK